MGDAQRSLNNSPYTFQVHWTNLDHVPRLLALEYSVATTTRHSSDVQELRTVDHMIIFPSSYANAICLDLETKTALVFPERRGYSRFHPVRRNLTGCIESLL
jgi:hypothetical protein